MGGILLPLSVCVLGGLGGGGMGVGGGGHRRTFVEWKMASKAPLLTFRSDNI